MSKISKRIAKKQNALKHGVYSREVMLPGEKIGDYEALRAAYYDEWAPDGVTEECLVEELFIMRWKKRRLDQYEQIRLQQRAAQIHQENELKRHRTNLKNLAAGFCEATSIEEVKKILSILSPLYTETLMVWVPRENYEDLAQWAAAVGKFLSEFKTKDHLDGADLFIAIVNPDQMEMEIARSIRLDEAIDRKIKRIIQVKAAKQIFPNMRKDRTSEPKLINAGVGVNRPVPAVFQAAQDTATTIELEVLAESSEANVPTATVVVAERDTSESGAASIAIGVTVFASAQNAAAPIELEVLAQPIEEDFATAAVGALVAGTDLEEGEHAPIASNIIENGQLIEHPAKVEIFTKPTPLAVADLQRYSVLCEELRESVGYRREPGLASWI